MKFYSFIYGNLLHLTAKQNVILLKNDEVIDFFFNMTAYRFFNIKMFKLKMLFNFQKLVTRYCR